jgi:hypothetical protein
MNWKGCERNWLQCNSAYDPGICPERLWETMKRLSQDSQSVDQDLSVMPPIYGEVPTIQL